MVGPQTQSGATPIVRFAGFPYFAFTKTNLVLCKMKADDYDEKID
jgi:hypothetical protein